MLYNLDWLAEGKMFPPKSELERLKMYQDNRLLFYGETEQVLKPYQERVQSIIKQFADIEGYNSKSFDSFGLDLNYFQAVTLKTGDLVAGEPPTVTIAGDKNMRKTNEKLATIFEAVDFDTKTLETVYDMSRFGEGIVRLYIDEDTKKEDYVINGPDIWFPIVSFENCKKIKNHVLAWVECTNPDDSEERKRYKLKVQVHGKGKYNAYEYDLKNAVINNRFTTPNGLRINLTTYTIGKLLLKQENISTGFEDFVVIPFTSVQTSDSCHGINDYDKICGILAELQVRYTLENIILDKHSCPTPYVPSTALRQNRDTSEWGFKTGGVVEMGPNDQPPGYMYWDASLQANRTQIEALEKHLYSLSEMGAIINDDAFGASQGFEALETRLTNARLKARRMSSRMTNPLKRLICALASKELKITPSDLTVYWNDGLPNNEYRETDIAAKKLQSGLMDIVTILMDHFDKSQAEAEEIVERIRQTSVNAFSAFDDIEDSNDDDSGNKGLNGDEQ